MANKELRNQYIESLRTGQTPPSMVPEVSEIEVKVSQPKPKKVSKETALLFPAADPSGLFDIQTRSLSTTLTPGKGYASPLYLGTVREAQNIKKLIAAESAELKKESKTTLHALRSEISNEIEKSKKEIQNMLAHWNSMPAESYRLEVKELPDFVVIPLNTKFVRVYNTLKNKIDRTYLSGGPAGGPGLPISVLGQYLNGVMRDFGTEIKSLTFGYSFNIPYVIVEVGGTKKALSIGEIDERTRRAQAYDQKLADLTEDLDSLYQKDWIAQNVLLQSVPSTPEEIAREEEKEIKAAEERAIYDEVRARYEDYIRENPPRPEKIQKGNISVPGDITDINFLFRLAENYNIHFTSTPKIGGKELSKDVVGILQGTRKPLPTTSLTELTVGSITGERFFLGQEGSVHITGKGPPRITKSGKGAPETSYAALRKKYIEELKAKAGQPSPSEGEPILPIPVLSKDEERRKYLAKLGVNLLKRVTEEQPEG